jgi:broad specificity phosphatase PhoE
MLSMKLIIIRHGETEENAAGIIQGQSHGTLSKEGIKQAQLVGERLKSEKIDFIYTSDLERALNTAKEIHKHHPEVPLIKRKEIREIHYGNLQDKQKDEINYYFHKENDPDYFKKNNVESLESAYGRVNKFLEEIKEKHKEETVVIVSHGDIIKVIFMVLKNIKIHEVDLISHKKNLIKKNTGVSIFENGKFTIINCAKHLD